ncbi:MAG: filamentous hemagglutinin N-terminal domain-containing protein [Candidatus Omnitrophica bacterium]|nr:filamentous hemagglutinin N-terminal domain-containing protein [Candidatus Omnitrophota bacterium]
MKAPRCARVLNLLLCVGVIMLPVRGYSLPEGEQVVAGSATFDRSADTLTINQGTDKLITNFDGFSIAQSEAVVFHQPSAASIALNRVIGQDPSVLLGSLSANGRVFLVNPNGVLFGQGCQVDSAGMVASTLDIANSDFLAGRYTFVGQAGEVVNRGYISSPGGFVALLGQSSRNEGVIEANFGSVVLAGASAVTLNLDPQGIISVVLDEAAIANPTGRASAAHNTGTIRAHGGKVVLTAKALEGIFSKAVNNEGIIEAQSVAGARGQVALIAEGKNQAAANSGTIDVSAKDGLADGGFIEISGDFVYIDGAIDASTIGGAPGELLIDPWDVTIVDHGLFDGLSGNTVGEWWLELCNYSVTIQADNDVIFDLRDDDLLDLDNFNTETFTIKAGRNIELNDDAIKTHGGDIKLYADYGGYRNGVGTVDLGTGAGLDTRGGDVKIQGAAVNVSAPIKSRGGAVSIESLTANVVQTASGDVETGGGNFHGTAALDYIMRNGSSINTGAGNLDITAERDIILGTSNIELAGCFTWKYIKEERSYRFIEFGYYYNDGTGFTYVPLSEGYNIGKDIFSPTQGSAEIPDNVFGFGFYTVFKPSGSSALTWYEDQAMNADGKDHVNTSGIRYGWEDMYNLGDRDFDDAVIDVTKSFSTLEPGAFLSSQRSVSLEARNGSIIQTGGKITVGNAASATPAAPVVIDSTPDKQTWSNDNTVDVSWMLTEPEPNPGTFTATAGDEFVMLSGAEIETNGGDATVIAENDIYLTLIDAANGDVIVTSSNGSIIDNDLGAVNASAAYPLQADYDIIGHNIQLSAPNGAIGAGGAGEEIDTAYPFADLGYGFSYRWSTNSSSNPDVWKDVVNAVLDSNGDWVFSTTSAPLADSASWYFHVASANNCHRSATVHYGPFFIDTTAPVILAGEATGTHGNLDWWLSDVTVAFSATDNLSGFAPDGSLNVDLAAQTTSGEGTGLFVTSDGVYDRAGNFAPGISAGPFKVDMTAPVIIAGTPQGTRGNGGDWWESDVTVPFSATDNLSGFAPDGALGIDLAPQTTVGEGMDLFVTSDGVYDIAGNFAAGIDAGPFTVVYPSGDLLAANGRNLRNYYEILSLHRFVSNEPATPTNFFGYRPLTPMDMTGFDEMELDEGAYDFIEGNLKSKKSPAPYFGL